MVSQRRGFWADCIYRFYFSKTILLFQAEQSRKNNWTILKNHDCAMSRQK